MRVLRMVAALSIAAASWSATSEAVNAAPITPLSVAAKPAVTSSADAVQVRFGGFRGGGWRGGGWGGGWRGGGWGWGIGALAAGALIGAATAPYWGDPYYAYAGPYGYPYGYAGVGYAPYYGGYGPYWRRRVGWYPGPW